MPFAFFKILIYGLNLENFEASPRITISVNAGVHPMTVALAPVPKVDYSVTKVNRTGRNSEIADFRVAPGRGPCCSYFSSFALVFTPYSPLRK